ncbi:MAG: ribonuclease R [Paludibacteraceae bacterium]|nr:ribonuclease R [Paludibacteraceae bacterium]
MRTKDLIAKRERRERKHARSERNHMEKKAQVKVPAKEVFTLPTDFSDEVLKELRQLPDIISQEEILRRRDMRDVLTFTIDPADAKDFDDALSFQVLENGNCQIGIHIADVTHYVVEGSAVDEEAYQRGTSIYLVDRVIPMLPERLCNELCSLRPNEDKLCMAVVVEMDEQAKVLRHKICRTVINSDYRLAYEEAMEMIDGRLEARGERQEVLLEALRTLNELAKQLRAKRFDHGAINFETPEVRFQLDEQGDPTEIVFHRSTDANHLIEEFMLLANRIVAKEVGGNKAKGERPFVYRVHDVPDPDKLVKLGNFIRQFGFHLRTSFKRSVQNKHINALLDSCQGTNSQTLIETLAIRAMAKAVYSTSNIGHYGLAFTHYTHFTSPIRRYPDIMVHRLISLYLLQSKTICRHDKEVLEEACVRCSDTEQMAQMAERDSIKEMQARWMSKHVGEEFDGVISGVTEFGLFVQIGDTLTEGLVPIRTIEPHDYMQYDEENYCLTAARSGNTYTLSDSVRVRVVKVDVERKKIDFALVEKRVNS